MNFPSNVHPSWHPKLHHVFNSMNVNTQELKQHLIANKLTCTPKFEFIFRNFNIDIHSINCIIVNDLPEVNSNGLLFGSNDQSNRSLNNVYVNLKKHVYNNEEDWSFDHTLKSWANQGVFMLNMFLIRDRAISKTSTAFSLEVLEAIYDVHIHLPILIIGKYSTSILKPYKLHNAIFSTIPASDAEFQDSNVLKIFSQKTNTKL